MTNDFLSSVLPAGPVEAKDGSPGTFILIGPPKVGKTTLAAALPEALHVCCDPNGVRFVTTTPVDVHTEAEKAKMTKYDFLLRLCSELRKQQPRRFKRLIIDKLDNVETWADGEATAYYKSTPVGANFIGRSVRELPKGGGYSYFWDSFTRIWNAMAGAAEQVLFLAALKETALDLQPGQAMDFSRKDMDLTGKVRNIAAGYADILGMVTRNEQDENWITFATRDKGVLAGSRMPRLEGRRFKVSWKQPDGKVIVDWSQIYTDLQPTNINI